jgi:hypothetical protein
MAVSAPAARISDGAARLVPFVEPELRKRLGATPDPEVVEALATAGAGYRKGPGADPPIDVPVNADEAVAEGFVERYWIGRNPSDPDRREERPEAEIWAGFNLQQLGLGRVGATIRAALAALALGVWNPLSERNSWKPLVDYMVARYRDGLT